MVELIAYVIDVGTEPACGFTACVVRRHAVRDERLDTCGNDCLEFLVDFGVDVGA
jgi:hypothetical protein